MKDTSSLIGVISAGFTIMTGLISFLARSLLRAIEQRQEQRFATLKAEMNGRLTGLANEVKILSEDVKVTGSEYSKEREKWEERFERVRDSLEKFLREDAAMEAIRGRKVDALFQVVDHIKEEVRTVGPEAMKRIEDMFRRAKEELRNDINSYLRNK
jgi:coenzyme F420-reducing hydrogenase delta subunit